MSRTLLSIVDPLGAVYGKTRRQVINSPVPDIPITVNIPQPIADSDTLGMVMVGEHLSIADGVLSVHVGQSAGDIVALDANGKVSDALIPETIARDNELEALRDVIDAEVAARAAADTALQGGLDTHTGNVNNPHGVTKAQVGLSAVTNDEQVKRTEMGVANGVATLDSTGRVPASQIPGAVDDILDVYIVGSTPLASDWISLTVDGEALTPVKDKIYVIQTSGEYYGNVYMWSGTTYVDIVNPDLSQYAKLAYVNRRVKVKTINTTNFVYFSSSSSGGGYSNVSIIAMGDDLQNGEIPIVLFKKQYVEKFAPYCSHILTGTQSVHAVMVYAKDSSMSNLAFVDKIIIISPETIPETFTEINGITNGAAAPDTYADKSYVDTEVDTAVAEQIKLNLVGTVSGTVITFQLDSSISRYALKHLHKYLLHMSLPISTVGGILPDNWTIQFSDRNGFIVPFNCVFHKNVTTACSVGDLCELQSYYPESGFEWDIQVVYYEYTENDSTVRVLYTYDATRETTHALSGAAITSAIANSDLRPNDVVICISTGGIYESGHVYKVTGEYVDGVIALDVVDITPSKASKVESISVLASEWVDDATIEPFTSKVTKTLTTALVDSDILSLNMDVIAQATSGIAIADITGQVLTLYAVTKPAQSVTVTVIIGG